MFFLGISAHLFIYLLLPAFLVVCFYFKGVSGTPEVVDSLPAVVSYSPSVCSVSGTTYVYRIKKRQVDQQVAEKPVFPELKQLPVYLPSFYFSPLMDHITLRAPPAL